jgi:hypothetical protein
MKIYINYDDALINNNYGRLRDLILLFRIPTGMHPQNGLPALVYKKKKKKPYNIQRINVGYRAIPIVKRHKNVKMLCKIG